MGGALGRFGIDRGDEGDGISHLADDDVREYRAVHLSRTESVHRNVPAGQHRHDAGQRGGSGRVDEVDARMRDGAAQDVAIEHARLA